MNSILGPEENIASVKFNSYTICGYNGFALLNGDIANYDDQTGYTSHAISENDRGIIVELGTNSIINHIKMLLWDRDSRSYSYFIEVSVDQRKWEKVIDHTGYHCRSWQFLYFSSRVVRYIRLVGTHCTSGDIFRVVALEAMQKTVQPELVNGLIKPEHNVALSGMGAIVLKGGAAAINADEDTYDGHNGFSAHGSIYGDHDCILIQLSQPYYIDSLGLLMWDLNFRKYLFYIEASIDNIHWKMVVDKRGELTRSWQQYSFDGCPVSFIKLVGIHDTDSGNAVNTYQFV